MTGKQLSLRDSERMTLPLKETGAKPFLKNTKEGKYYKKKEEINKRSNKLDPKSFQRSVHMELTGPVSDRSFRGDILA